MLADVLLVVDDENGRHVASALPPRGSSSVNRLPRPELALELDAPAVRLHDVAHDREAEPGARRVAASDDCAKRSKMRSRCSAGMPGPVSLTDSRTPSLGGRVDMRIPPPRGV